MEAEKPDERKSAAYDRVKALLDDLTDKYIADEMGGETYSLVE